MGWTDAGEEEGRKTLLLSKQWKFRPQDLKGQKLAEKAASSLGFVRGFSFGRGATRWCEWKPTYSLHHPHFPKLLIGFTRP